MPISTGGGFKAPKSRKARMPLAAGVGGVLGLGLVVAMTRREMVLDTDELRGMRG